MNLRRWLLALFCWDGVLPAVVLGIPWALSNFRLPDAAQLAITLVLPIAAFFWRLVAYQRYWAGFEQPASPGYVRGVAFFMALFVLLMFDTILITVRFLPANRANHKDVLAIGAMLAIYFSLMAIALCPPRAMPEPAADDGNARCPY